MVNHYLKTALRNLSRNRGQAIINISGLVIGLGVCLLIYQYIHFELRFDDFHFNTQNTFRLTQTEMRNGEELSSGVLTTSSLGSSSKEAIPEVAEVVRIRPMEFRVVMSNSENNRVHLEEGLWYTDNNFFQLFNFPLAYGDNKTALVEKHCIVITEKMATKYFGDKNPLGKNLEIKGGSLSGNFIVSGVIKALPKNSHMHFNFILPLEFLLENWGSYKHSNGWDYADFITYIKVNDQVNRDEIGKKIDYLIGENMGDVMASKNLELQTGLQAITDIHLNSTHLKNDPSKNNGSMKNVQFFVIIAIFILSMALINYVNLITAHSMQRAKEVGVRKSIGAFRFQLIGQFILESLLINLIAASLAIILAYFMLPVLNNIIGKSLEFNILHNLTFWVGFSILIFCCSLLSGLYPAFVLSSFKPMSVFQSGNINPNKVFSARRTLFVFQFVTSILLISGTYLIYQQITFMKNKELGIDMDKILVLNGPRVVMESLQEEGVTLESKYQLFKSKATSFHSIQDITATVTVPGRGYLSSERFWEMGNPENDAEGSIVLADYDFPETYELDFIAGTTFSSGVNTEYLTIINESAVNKFGWKGPEEALNKNLTNGGDTLKIIGVVKNVHWNKMQENHSSILYILNNEYGAYLSIKMNLSDVSETIAHIESAFHEVFPNDPFHYFFLDQDFNNQYQSDLRFRKVFAVFSVLAIVIACLGLYSLVSFSTSQRIKEIGIRKVFGAGIKNLMLLLSKEYLLLVLLANVIAIPLILFGAKYWLESYAFRISVGLDLFLVPGILLLLISFLTVCYRIFITAKVNPINCLRNE